MTAPCAGGFCGRDGSIRPCESDAIDGTPYCAIHQRQHVLMPMKTPGELRAEGAAEERARIGVELEALRARLSFLEGAVSALRCLVHARPKNRYR